MRGPLSSRLLLTVAMAICLAAALAGSGLEPRLSAASSLPAEIPFKIESGALTIEAGLGAGLPMRAVLDTGIGETLISTRIASDRGMSGFREVMIASPFGPIRAASAGMHSIRLGRVVIDGVLLFIGDPTAQFSGGTGSSSGTSPSLAAAGSDSASPSRAQVPDAWIGNAVLSLGSVEVDPANKRLLLAPPNAPPIRGGTPVPMEIVNGRIEVKARANGSAEFKAILATGVRGSLLPASVVRSLKLSVASERTVSMPAGAPVRIGNARLKELRLGSAKITDVPVLAALDDIPGVAAGTGLIGTDALMQFRMQISYMRKQAVFAALPKAKPERRPQPERPIVQRKPGLSMPKRDPQAE